MTVNHIIDSWQKIFLQQTRTLERSSGFCQRRSRVSASAFVQGLVFGWLQEPNASVSALARAVAVAGSPVSPQGLQQRFTWASATLLRQVLVALMVQGLEKTQPCQRSCESSSTDGWLHHFSSIWIRDSTVLTLPLAMQTKWPGCGGATGPSAGLKVSVLWEWHSGTLAPLQLTAASEHDKSIVWPEDSDSANDSANEMHLFDLGYFSLDWMEQLHHKGAFFCCRYKAGTLLYTAPDQRKARPLVQQLAQLPSATGHTQWNVWLGHKHRLPCRLLVQRVPPAIAAQRRAQLQASCQRKRRALSQERLELCGWNLWLTNAPEEKLAPAQVEVLYRLRWQIERLFRLWKETLSLDCWRSQNPQRILCEIYAKLIGALLTQKLTVFCKWPDPARSLVKCAQTIASYALALLTHLPLGPSLRTTLRALRRACTCATKLESRRKRPATFQRIASTLSP